jgi:carbonic anhydrase
MIALFESLHVGVRQSIKFREASPMTKVLDDVLAANQRYTDEVMRSLLRQSLDTAELRAGGWHDVGRGPGSTEGDFIDWLTIESQTESVTSDVRRIRSHPLVPRSVAIYGYVYDVKNGQLVEVPEATRAGQTR